MKRAEASISTQIDSHRRQSLDPIFSHSGDTRVAASVTLAGMVFFLIASTVLALGLPQKLTLQIPAPVSTATAPPSGPVRVVGSTASAGISCEQQTWPYIDQRCLTRTEAKPRTDAAHADAQTGDKLTPMTATAPVVAGAPPQQSETTGSPPQNDSAQPAPPRAQKAINVPAAPDATTADADDDVPQQRVIEPPRRPRSSRQNGFPGQFGFFRLF